MDELQQKAFIKEGAKATLGTVLRLRGSCSGRASLARALMALKAGWLVFFIIWKHTISAGQSTQQQAWMAMMHLPPRS